MNESTRFCVGIDVAKDKLDVAWSDRPGVKTFPRNADGLRRLLAALKDSCPDLICLEATGGLERSLVETLQQHRFSVAVVNPRQIRDFARAGGQLAKTDAIDAAVIAQFAMKMSPRITPPVSKLRRTLLDLAARRRQVVKTIVQEKARLSTTVDKSIRRMIEQAIRFYEKQRDTIRRKQQELIAADEPLQAKATILTSVPGLGEATANVLIAELPELGSLNQKQIARLVGVAPTNRDSGTMRGQRTTGGGRVDVRNALFMPTVVAKQFNPTIKRFYNRLVASGKAKMTALIAAMRKLLTILNTMIKNQTPWNPPKTT